MRQYDLAIFDMDGTILDTLEDLHDTLNYVLKMQGYPLRSIAETKSFLGNGIRMLLKRALPQDTDEENIERAFVAFKAYYDGHCAIKTRPYEGIVELLRLLRDNGIQTAVVSNKADFAVQNLCKDYYDGLFDAALGEREEFSRKPSPDMVNEILRRLNISANRAIYIGDSDVDLLTAKNAQLPCIAVTWGFRERAFLIENGATLMANTPAEVARIVLQDGGNTNVKTR